MKQLAYFIFLAFVITSCANETKTADVSETDPADSVSQTTPLNESKELQAPPFSVEIDEDTQELKIVKSEESLGGLEIADIITALNKKYPGIKMVLKSPVQETIEIEITDATQLTQQMGTTGAEAFLAEATYSLTEIAGVKAVRFSFEEGDHARPGVYNRESFKTLR